jgi:hypothetical protein
LFLKVYDGVGVSEANAHSADGRVAKQNGQDDRSVQNILRIYTLYCGHGGGVGTTILPDRVADRPPSASDGACHLRARKGSPGRRVTVIAVAPRTHVHACGMFTRARARARTTYARGQAAGGDADRREVTGRQARTTHAEQHLQGSASVFAT